MDTELKQHKVTLGYTQGECTDFDLNSYLYSSTFSVPRIYDAFDVAIQQLLLSALSELGL